MKTKKLINYFIFTINDITYLPCYYIYKLKYIYIGALLNCFPNQDIPDIGKLYQLEFFLVFSEEIDCAQMVDPNYLP